MVLTDQGNCPLPCLTSLPISYPKTCHTPNPFHPSPLFHYHPNLTRSSTHQFGAAPWKITINRAARGVFAEWDTFEFLFGVCDDAVWAVLNTPPGQQLRPRPDFSAPADLQANAGPDWLIFKPMLVLLPVTLSNAPRMPGQLDLRA